VCEGEGRVCDKVFDKVFSKYSIVSLSASVVHSGVCCFECVFYTALPLAFRRRFTITSRHTQSKKRQTRKQDNVGTQPR